MSEISGYVLIHSEDDKTFNDMVKEFEKENSIDIDGDEYQVWDVKSDRVIDLYLYTSEYADTDKLSKYIQKKYKPNILISSFDTKAFINGKKVARKKAFTALSELSPQIGFYLNIEYENYKKAYEILCDNEIPLTDKVAGVPHFERCFFGEYAPLLEYAVDRGYHDHYCQYDANFPFDEDGVHCLHRVIRTSNLDLVKKALALGASANEVDGDKCTLLHYIGWLAFDDDLNFDALEMIRLLADYDADFNAKDWAGSTPILSLFSHVEDKIEDNQETIAAILDAFIEHGASVEVYDKSGAGLLTYYSNYKDIQSKFLKVKPDLQPFIDEFDIDSYIKKRAHIHSRKLPRDYDTYFKKCIELDFIDFMFEDIQVDILKSLKIEQIYNILMVIPSSKNAVKIIKGLSDNDLPIFIEQNIEDGAAEMQHIDIFNYEDNSELVDLFHELCSKPHKRLVYNYSSMGFLGNKRALIDVV